MVRLERLGIPTAAVATEPFIDEALEQARVLGMPDYRMVFIPHPVQLLTLEQARVLGMPDYRMVFIAHPVQLLTLEELRERADRVFDLIVARLTPRPDPPADAARPRS